MNKKHALLCSHTDKFRANYILHTQTLFSKLSFLLFKLSKLHLLITAYD